MGCVSHGLGKPEEKTTKDGRFSHLNLDPTQLESRAQCFKSKLYYPRIAPVGYNSTASVHPYMDGSPELSVPSDACPPLPSYVGITYL